MRRARWLIAFMMALAPEATMAQADMAVLQRADGTSATVADLGNGIGIIADPHGETVPKPLTPHLDSTTAGPQSRPVPTPGTIFGTPAPPNQLTPPPILPLQPNRPIQQAPTVPGSVGSSPGRFGR